MRARAVGEGARRGAQDGGRAGGGAAAPDSPRPARLRFSGAVLDACSHTRAAEKALANEGVDPPGRVGRSLGAIADLTRSVQGEMRALIFELRRDPVRRRARCRARAARRGSGSADGLTHRRARAAAAAGVSEQVRDAAVRHRARGARECPEARRGERGARSRRGPDRAQVRARGRATTDAGSIRTPAIPATSAWSRCAAVPPRSAVASRSRAHPGSGTVVRVRVPAGPDGG